MYKIKIEDEDFTFQLYFFGKLAKSLEKMSMESRKELLNKTENLLKSFCSFIAAFIVFPAISSHALSKAFEAMRNLVAEGKKEFRRATNDKAN
jgi:hypothetical protein